MTQTDNVTPICPEAEEDDYAAVNAFDNLISDWLAIEAKSRDSRRDTSDAALGRICDQRWKLLWKVASTPAD